MMGKNGQRRSHWTAAIVMRCTAVSAGGLDSETVQDVMLGAVERRFGIVGGVNDGKRFVLLVV
ncbi:hypothetical protein D9D60_10605 [Escherichia coli]|nr:hypothetical protein [Escherichia coli]